MGASLLAFGRMILVLGIIIAMIYFLARFAQKHQVGAAPRTGSKSRGQIEVLSRRSLGQHASVNVIKVANHIFLVGQSSQQMTLLAEIDEEEWSEFEFQGMGPNGSNKSNLTPGTAIGAGGFSSAAWDAFVERLRELTVRR